MGGGTAVSEATHGVAPDWPRQARSFSDQADGLRSQFEWRMVAAGGGAFEPADPALGRFEVGAAEQFFGQSALWALVEDLRLWGRRAFGANHASTPQARLYRRGARDFALERSPAKWRYAFSLTGHGCAPAELTLTAPSSAAAYVSRAAVHALAFNELLVFSASIPYAVAWAGRRSDWFTAPLLLEGWLW